MIPMAHSAGKKCGGFVKNSPSDWKEVCCIEKDFEEGSKTVPYADVGNGDSGVLLFVAGVCGRL